MMFAGQNKIMVPMDVNQILVTPLSKEGTVTSEVAVALEQPKTRQQLYDALLAHSTQANRELLQHLLQVEVRYRTALGKLEVEDHENHYAGIYKCAYLLGRCGDPSDTFLLWEAKFTDFDVGSTMGAEFFVGAGVDQTLSYLAQCSAKFAREIYDYVYEYFSHEGAFEWQKRWEQSCASDLNNLL